MLTLVLAVLSISAAAGMRLALPLLVISLFYSQEFWSDVPVLRHLDPRVVLAISISWSLLELFISKQLLGQRVLQIIQLLFSPILGAIVAVAFAHIAEIDFTPFWIIGLVGGIFALVLTIVQIGWFFSSARTSSVGSFITRYFGSFSRVSGIRFSYRRRLDCSIITMVGNSQFHCLA